MSASSEDAKGELLEATMTRKHRRETHFQEMYRVQCGAPVCRAGLGDALRYNPLVFSKELAYSEVTTGKKPALRDWILVHPDGIEPVMGKQPVAEGLKEYRVVRRSDPLTTPPKPRRKKEGPVGEFSRLEGRQSLGSYPVLPVVVRCGECGRPSAVRPPLTAPFDPIADAGIDRRRWIDPFGQGT